MPNPQPDDLRKWHRWFAVECNNNAWDVAEACTGSPDDLEAMVRCAFASAWHWQQVGEPVNLLRADHLLAWVHAVADRADNAKRYTRSAQAQLEEGIPGVQDWDRLFHQLVVARTHLTLGHSDDADAALIAADAMAESLEERDRAVYDRFRQACVVSS